MMGFLLLLVVVPCVLANQYIRQPYNNDSEFNNASKFGENITLYCRDNNLEGVSFSIEYWILPNNTVLQKGKILFQELHPIDGIGSWEVSDAGDKLHAINIREPHFGLYYCMVKSTTSDLLYAVKKGINYNGPYFGDLWEVYRRNTMIGGIAAAAFLVLAGICSVIYLLKFKDKDNDSQISPAEREYENAYENADTLQASRNLAGPSSAQAYTNLAYTIDKLPSYSPGDSSRFPHEDTTQL